MTVAAGQLYKFIVEVSRPDGASYQWQVKENASSAWRDFTEKKTALTKQLYFTVTEAMHGWQFRCVVKNGSDTVTSTPFTVSITGKAVSTPTPIPTKAPTAVPTKAPTEAPGQEALKILSQPVSVTVTADTLNKFPVTVNKPDGASYQWQVKESASSAWRNFTEKKTALTSQLYFTVTAAMNGWQFRCIVKNGTETVTSKAFTVTVSGAGSAAGGKKIICIDPGHQKKSNTAKEAVGPGSSTTKYKVTAGATGMATKQLESELNLKVGLALKTELEKRGYTVVMTRISQDVNLSNQERAAIANNAKADAMIHLHANSSSDTSIRGANAICMPKTSPYNPSLYTQSYALSTKVLAAMTKKSGIASRGVRTSNSYTGINWSKVPVTIVEMGYLSNAAEDKLLATSACQKNIVQGIADGIDAYFAG